MDPPIYLKMIIKGYEYGIYRTGIRKTKVDLEKISLHTFEEAHEESKEE